MARYARASASWPLARSSGFVRLRKGVRKTIVRSSQIRKRPPLWVRARVRALASGGGGSQARAWCSSLSCVLHAARVRSCGGAALRGACYMHTQHALAQGAARALLKKTTGFALLRGRKILGFRGGARRVFLCAGGVPGGARARASSGARGACGAAGRLRRPAGALRAPARKVMISKSRPFVFGPTVSCAICAVCVLGLAP